MQWAIGSLQHGKVLVMFLLGGSLVILFSFKVLNSRELVNIWLSYLVTGSNITSIGRILSMFTNILS